MTDKLREAAQQALKALEYYECRNIEWEYADKYAIAALRAALVQQDAQAVPKPIGYTRPFDLEALQNPANPTVSLVVARDAFGFCTAPIYAAPTPPAQQGAQVVPQGWKLVPVEPTPEMIYAAQVEGNAHTADEIVDDYRAMLYAATTPPAQRVTLTDEEICDLWSWSMTAEAERTANTQQHAFAQGVIEAYERKNGIK